MGPDIDLPWMFHTDPGCDHPTHRAEIAGAMFGLQQTGPWSGETLMDCGCIMTLCNADGTPVTDAPELTFNRARPNRAQRRARGPRHHR